MLERHISALFCATDTPNSGLREDILDRLLQEQVDLNSCLDSGRSLFCFALCNNVYADSVGYLYTRIQDLELLLNKGVSMTACRMHDSPLLCATSDRILLQESLIKLLLEKGACEEDSGWKVLQNAKKWEILSRAIGSCEYEVGAIQLLLDIPGMMDCIKTSKESILYIAFMNVNYQNEAVELLLSRMSYREITGSKYLLHTAVQHRWCSSRILKLLLKYDLPVNERNGSLETPLYIAVENCFGYGDLNCKVIEELLMAGAKIGEEKCCRPSFLLDYVLKKYIMSGKNFNSHTVKIFKILLKFYFLQNPKFDCKRSANENTWHKAIFDNGEFKQYAIECLQELKEIESRQIGEGFTLCEFVRGYCLPDEQCHESTNLEKKNLKLKIMLRNMTQSCLSNEPESSRWASKEIGNLYQLFKSLEDNKVKVYFDVILARLDLSVMKQTLQNINVYTSNKSPDGEKVYLNENVVDKISTFLSKTDLLSFIIAFYNPNKSAIVNLLGGKRSTDLTTKEYKFPKLC